jgi:hypothetical protein
MTIWHCREDADGWTEVALRRGQPLPLSPEVLLIPLRPGKCALLSRGAVTVNGLVVFPLRMLSDRDEIRVGGATLYFSADAPAEVVVFAAQEKEIACGRCKGKLHAGDLVVECPLCAAWHHQSDKLPCWKETAKCSGCDRSTARINWQPEPRCRACTKHNLWSLDIHASKKSN